MWRKGKKIEHKLDVNNKNVLTSNEINELGLKLIKQHIDKPLSFHLDNLKKIIFLLKKIKLNIIFKNTGKKLFQ